MGGPLTLTSTVNIAVGHTDLPPVNTVPGVQNTANATPLVFSSGKGNAISVSDSDSGGGVEQISLSVNQGTLTFSGTTGLTVTAGANASATMTMLQGHAGQHQRRLERPDLRLDAVLQRHGHADAGQQSLGDWTWQPLTLTGTSHLAVGHLDLAP